MISSKSLLPTNTTLGSSLPAKVQQLAAKQVILDITSKGNNDSSVTRINPGKVINHFPIPDKITVDLENTNNATSTVQFFNASTLNAMTNGVTVSYSDGFGGKLLENLFKTLDGGSGLLTYGFNITGIDADGNKSDTVLNNALLQARYYDGYGDSYVPENISIAGAERNTQFKEGLLTVKTAVLINTLMQMKASIGAGCKLQFVFFTSPIQD